MRQLLVVMLSSLVAFGVAQQFEPPNPTNSIRYNGRVMERINPVLDTNLDRIPYWVFDGLVRFSADLQPEGALAERWEITDDGLSYTFYLRPGVTWHDGTPFTADDVVFTTQVALDPATQSGIRHHFMVAGEPVSATKIDDMTVRFDLPRPSNAFLNSMFLARFVPKHLLEGQDIQTAEYNLMPVGTGPYQVVEFIPGQRAILRAYQDYYMGAPKILYWIWIPTQDQNAALAALASRDLNAIGVGSADAVATASQMSDINVYGYNSGFTFTFVFNNRKPGLDERAVRQAIAYAIDRPTMVHSIAGENIAVAWSAIGPTGTWQYNDNVRTYDRDPERAMALLEEAGWRPGPDGVRTKDGARLEFEVVIQAQATDSSPLPFALVIQEALANIGIQLNIAQLDRPSLQQRITEDFDTYLWWGGYSFVPDLTLRIHSDYDNTGYASPELDEMLNLAMTTPDHDLRKATLDAIAERISEDVPFIPLYYYRGNFALDASIGSIPEPSSADPNNSGIFYRLWELTIGN
jgi:peptide/nickel transport system substrate-binding protein